MEYLTMKKKMNVLEHAFAASAGAYYSINLTKNLVPGSMYQVINDKEYSLNEQMGLPENARFTDVIAYWGNKLDDSEKESYFEFMAIPNLLKQFETGKNHVFHKYWTKSAIFEPMLAEQHIVMYKDEENGDVLAITYVLDLTQEFKEDKYKCELEEKQEKLEEALAEAKKVGQYREIQAAVTAVDDILNKLAVFNRISSEAELNLIMPELLASLGRYSMSDRAYIFTWASQEQQSLRMTHEWCADGVVPTIDQMQDLHINDMPNWTPKLKNGEAIVCADWEAEKSNTPEEYALFDGQDIHSLIVIPVFAHNKLNGYIGFDNPEQSRAALSVRLLSSIGGHISSLKDNFFMMEELKKKQEILKTSLKEISREKNILDALSIDYTSVYYCDLKKDIMIALKQEDDTNAAVTENKISEGLQTYSFRIQYYFENFVVKESAPDFVYKLSPQYLMEYLSHNKRFAYRFRTYPNPAGQQYFEVQIVRLSNSTGYKIVMGYRYIDDIVAEQEKQKMQLESALANATVNSEIISSISKLYWLIYKMDLVTGTYEEISAGSEMHTLTGKRGNISEVFWEVRETVVSQEYQEIMKAFLDTETLAERLQDTESIAAEYQASNGSWHLARFIVKKRDETGKVLNVLYVVRKIDREKQAEIQYEQEQLKHNRILSGLSVDYTIAFALDLDSDDYEIIFSQETNHAKEENNIIKFADYVARYAENYALPEFREAMKQELNSNTIKECFRSKDDYYFSFETIPNAAGLSYFQAHIVKQYDGEQHYAFLGFRSVDEIVKKERFYQNALQVANSSLKRQLDMITFALPGGVKISNDDETYSFKYVSEQFAHMLGYDTSKELMEASGGTIVGLAHPDDLEHGIADALEQYSRADHYEITYRMKCKDGSWKYIEDRGHKFRNAEGNVEHWNLILDKHDLMEKTIALESEKLANQAKSDFLSRMSHDMRTPLNGIIGLLDICIKHPEDRQLVDSSRLKARVAADHLLSLINDTLELSKLEKKEIPLETETFHVPSLMQEVKTIVQMRADKDNISIFYEDDMEQFLYPYLIGSPVQVKQILVNLINNGIKYNQENGAVYISLRENCISDTRVELDISIRDTGIGMSETFLKDIYKPFVQADTGARSRYMGTGLGMAIVKNLLERMNGTIDIKSKKDNGTTVNVTIPFEIARKTTSAKIADEDERSSLNGLHILLAEDNELNREIAVFVLEDENISVTQAVDGKEALDIFVKKPEYYFDAVLMDIMMPNMDGYQATNAIRNCGKKDAKTVPVIAMTANAFDDDRKKTQEAGMNAHLTKPLNVPELMKTIGTLCNRSERDNG